MHKTTVVAQLLIPKSNQWPIRLKVSFEKSCLCDFKKFIATCFHQYFFIISALVLDSQKVLIFLTLESIMAFVFLKIQLFCQ
jgi:hypothetical protein